MTKNQTKALKEHFDMMNTFSVSNNEI